MRSVLVFLVAVLSLSVFSAGAVLAQTATKPPSNREQLRIDSDDCAKQVDRQRIDLFADCMNKKEIARKEAARQKKAEEAARRKQQRTERFEAAVASNRDANLQRIAQENAARAKRDDCKKQAKEQKLHLMTRLNFIKTCMEK
jgi:hypothetical protein